MVSLRSAAPVISANFYVNGTLTPLSNLAPPFNFTIPLISTSLPVQRLTQAVFSAFPSTSKDQVIEKREVSCQFYDSVSHSLSTQGCSVVDFTSTTVTCSCTHLTDFMGFVSSTLSALDDSNTHFTFISLRSNVGFFLSLVYWTTFIIFGVIFLHTDQRSIHNSKH